jgi:hypothetical protein
MQGQESGNPRGRYGAKRRAYPREENGIVRLHSASLILWACRNDQRGSLR